MFDKTAKLEKAYRRYPRAPLFARLADACLRRGKTARALALCEEGCRSFPDYPTGYFVLSRCFEAQGQLEEAREALDRGLRLDPRCPAPFRQLSNLYTRMGNATLARKCLEVASQLDPFSESLSQELAILTAASAAAETAGTLAAENGEAISEPDDGVAVGEGLDPVPHEPFAQLEVVPDWTIDGDIPVAADASREPPQTAPAEMPALLDQDEVAALGAELAELFDSSDAPPAEPIQALADDAVGPIGTEVGPPEPVSVEEVASGALDGTPPDPGEATGTASEESVLTPVEVGDEAGSSAEIEFPPLPGVDEDGLGGVEGMPPPAPLPAPLPAAGPAAAPQREARPQASAVARFSNGDEDLAALLGDLSRGAPTAGNSGPTEAEQKPVPPVPTPTLARLYTEQGFTDRAAQIYRQVLQARPDDQEAHAALAGLTGH